LEYISIEEQVDADFARARRRAFLRRVGARLRGGSTAPHLASFEEIRTTLEAYNKVRLGRRTVLVERIVGSVGRYEDFDPVFMPARASLRTRWKRVDRAFHRSEQLPPVRLYKVADAYYVEDGNHRVSVARYQGVQWIDAEVVELGHPLSVLRASVGAVSHASCSASARTTHGDTPRSVRSSQG
jgi:hypothetical protein